ncbi:Hypothetical predicted protein [Mytilus galloprovincialis]|uniref:Sacsin/Nov domain-containing protein n=1 Tax=Mytilus galloprovincialis TaxID=29158 RepID=A0A8B6CRV5_MYTGA|nr:Hypothetical predicted protein [Mytilus galloprovincialis]
MDLQFLRSLYKMQMMLGPPRENVEWRNGLFDQGMAECQGPALWVYNDAIFKEEDFKNIIELGGKTKILDTEKIGKFGLGFCSVYNVTDVPSFVSKNTLVILDPTFTIILVKLLSVQILV